MLVCCLSRKVIESIPFVFAGDDIRIAFDELLILIGLVSRFNIDVACEFKLVPIKFGDARCLFELSSVYRKIFKIKLIY